MVTYKTESHERNIREKNFLVVNLTPNLTPADASSLKKDIEQQLYEIFRKYAAVNS